MTKTEKTVSLSGLVSHFPTWKPKGERKLGVAGGRTEPEVQLEVKGVKQTQSQDWNKVWSRNKQKLVSLELGGLRMLSARTEIACQGDSEQGCCISFLRLPEASE